MHITYHHGGQFLEIEGTNEWTRWQQCLQILKRWLRRVNECPTDFGGVSIQVRGGSDILETKVKIDTIFSERWDAKRTMTNSNDESDESKNEKDSTIMWWWSHEVSKNITDISYQAFGSLFWHSRPTTNCRASTKWTAGWREGVTRWRNPFSGIELCNGHYRFMND